MSMYIKIIMVKAVELAIVLSLGYYMGVFK